MPVLGSNNSRKTDGDLPTAWRRTAIPSSDAGQSQVRPFPLLRVSAHIPSLVVALVADDLLLDALFNSQLSAPVADTLTGCCQRRRRKSVNLCVPSYCSRLGQNTDFAPFSSLTYLQSFPMFSPPHSSNDRGFRPLPETFSAMSGPQYDPLPLNGDHHDDAPYNNGPPSPGAHLSHFQNAETEPLGPYEDDLGASSMRPRFLGAALMDEGPRPRESYADSSNSFPIGDDAQSSIYGLNPGGQQRDTAFYSLNYRDDPHDSDFASSRASIGFNNKNGMQSSPYLPEKRTAYVPPRERARKRLWLIGGLVAGVIIAIIAVVAIYFAVIKPHHSNDSVSGGASKGGQSAGTTSTAGSASPSASNKPSQALVVTGGDGTKVTMDDGTTFTYHNSFGGSWYWDPTDPLNNGARAQSWSPALNETFKYGVDKIRG